MHAGVLVAQRIRFALVALMLWPRARYDDHAATLAACAPVHDTHSAWRRQHAKLSALAHVESSALSGYGRPAICRVIVLSPLPRRRSRVLHGPPEYFYYRNAASAPDTPCSSPVLESAADRQNIVERLGSESGAIALITRQPRRVCADTRAVSLLSARYFASDTSPRSSRITWWCDGVALVSFADSDGRAGSNRSLHCPR